MAKSKITKIQKWLIFTYLVIFPFGQLARINLNTISFPIPDLIAALSGLLFLIFSYREFLKEKLKIKNLIAILIFSLLVNLVKDLSSILYLFRFFFYLVFLLNIKLLSDQDKKFKVLLLKSLVIVGLVSAIFGWIQYIFVPDLRPLFILGWDDHYYRLAGTFLDPAFAGIIFVLTYILLLTQNFIKNNYFKILSLTFMLITIGLTYSRSSILAALISTIIFLVIRNKKRFALLVTSFILIMVLLLPKASSEGTNLLRTASINLKINNFQTSIQIIKSHPLFGVGYNAICSYKRNFHIDNNPESHSCGGLDNSFLFMIATTGITGIIMFLYFFIEIYKNVRKDQKVLILVSSIALFTHALFTNTIFYSCVMGWFAILIGVSLASTINKK